MSFDCGRCGACCCNPKANRDEGYTAYVELADPKSKLLRDRGLRRKFVVTDAQGRSHLRLLGDRCAALRGAVGRQVRCVVYAHRPQGCRRVQAGDDDCLQARADAGL